MTSLTINEGEILEHQKQLTTKMTFSIQRMLNFEIISFIFQLFILSVCIRKTKIVLVYYICT
jgi:hypothetical protein